MALTVEHHTTAPVPLHVEDVNSCTSGTMWRVVAHRRQEVSLACTISLTTGLTDLVGPFLD